MQAAEDLLLENDDQRLRRYLEIFHGRDFPKQSQTIFHLVKYQNPWVARGATRALSRLNDPEIRTYALQLLAEGHDPAVTVRLLRKTFVSGDLQAVETAMKRDTMNDDAWHGLGLAVLSLVANASVSAAECRNLFVELYCQGPCSMCRSGFVEKLNETGDLPDWMANECLYDAAPDTAALFKGKTEP